MSNNRYALIVAGGSGVRMGNQLPKQFLPLAGMTILMHTLTLFHRLNTMPSIYLVLPSQQFELWETLCLEHAFTLPHTLVEGGDTRFNSVQNGLNAMYGNGLVAIHDGVRPLVTPAVVEECYRVASEKGNAIPAIRPVETVRFGSPSSSLHMNRDEVWLVQTPQVFELNRIKKHYQCAWNEMFTDDASVAEANGDTINLVLGNPENIKITNPMDMALAEAIIKTVRI
jgi:2-C-methyl-D-erythritol 4-phosphate cytidylyltransferase